MMNKNRSSRVHLLKFLFVLPLAGVLLLAFRQRQAEAVTAGPQRSVLVPDTSAPKKALPAEALYLVDGETSTAAKVKALNPADIYSMNVLKGEEAMSLFGEKGKNGVIAITTKQFHSKHPVSKDTLSRPVKVVSDTPPVKADRDTPPAKVVRDTPTMGVVPDQPPMKAIVDSPLLTGKPGAQPLYVIDGVETSSIPEGLEPGLIESVSVLKDKAARVIYGEKGKNGVILITLKKK